MMITGSQGKGKKTMDTQ